MPLGAPQGPQEREPRCGAGAGMFSCNTEQIRNVKMKIINIKIFSKELNKAGIFYLSIGRVLIIKMINTNNVKVEI